MPIPKKRIVIDSTNESRNVGKIKKLKNKILKTDAFITYRRTAPVPTDGLPFDKRPILQALRRDSF